MEGSKERTLEQDVIDRINEEVDVAIMKHEGRETERVNSSESLKQLSEPVSFKKLGWKPQATRGSKALAVAFIQARDVEDRLDSVVGIGNWSWTISDLVLNNKPIVCTGVLTIYRNSVAGTVRMEGVGTDDTDPKAAESDALKRAAVHFGIGRYLYTIGTEWVSYDSNSKTLTSYPILPKRAVPECEWAEYTEYLKGYTAGTEWEVESDQKAGTPADTPETESPLEEVKNQILSYMEKFEDTDPTDGEIADFNSLMFQMDPDDVARPVNVANMMDFLYGGGDANSARLMALATFFAETNGVDGSLAKEGDAFVLRDSGQQWYEYMSAELRA